MSADVHGGGRRKGCEHLNGRIWLPRDPLLSATAHLAAGCLLAGSAILTVVGGVLVAHHGRAGWVDRSVDSMIKAALAGHDGFLGPVADLAEPVHMTVLIAVVVLACMAAKRLNGALLAVVSVPAAAGLAEGLKRVVGRTLGGSLTYPSGHTTAAFALAAVVTIVMLSPSRHMLPFAIRLTVAIASMLTACSVAIAVIGLGWHYFSDTLAGAAVGMGVVLAVALLLDFLLRHIFSQHELCPAAAPAKAADEVPSRRQG
jgi:membrane-associated phospholipid phosphatase